MNQWLEELPMWGMLLLTVLIILIPVQLGQRLGIRARKATDKMQEAPVGSVVGAALGLLAFMLAFTFQIATNRYDARKQLLLEHVASISDVYLRAELLPEPHRSDSRKMVREYVDLLIETTTESGKLKHVQLRSRELHQGLWEQAKALAEQDRSSEVYALFTSSVNELINVHNQRVTVAFHYRINPTILWVLYFIAFFSMMLLGFQFGISGKGSPITHLALAVVFAAVMWLILALNNPEKGYIKVNQQPMIALHKQLHESP